MNNALKGLTGYNQEFTERMRVVMCGRFTFIVDQEKLAELLYWLNINKDLKPSYNIAPSQNVPVVRNNGLKELEFVKWGFVPSFLDDVSSGFNPINARVETAHSNGYFRRSFSSKRCLVFASSYYEWTKNLPGFDGKTPVLIKLKNSPLMVFAGLWDEWTSEESDESIVTCCILTKESNEQLRQYHSRMPVILNPDYYQEWISPEKRNPEELKCFLTSPQEEFEVYPVSKIVNSPKNNSPQCVEPLSE